MEPYSRTETVRAERKRSFETTVYIYTHSLWYHENRHKATSREKTHAYNDMMYTTYHMGYAEISAF